MTLETMAPSRFQAGFVVAVLAALAVFYYWLTWIPGAPLMDGDDAVYLLMADFFSPISARNPEVTGLVMRHSFFPPLYPMLLALTGGTTAHPGLVHVLTTTFLVGSILVLYLWGRSAMNDTALGLVLAAMFALAPVTVAMSFEILSENLYLLLTLVALWLLGRPDVTDRQQYLGAVAVGLAAATRSIGLALVLAYAVQLLIRRDGGRWRFFAISVAPLILWSLTKAALGYRGSYVHLLLSTTADVPLVEMAGAQLRVVPENFWNGWLGSFGLVPTLAGGAIGVMLGVASAASLMLRLKSLRLDAIYVAIYLLIVVAWPYSYDAKRFLYPILPILLFQSLTQLSTAVPDRWRDPLPVRLLPWLYGMIVFAAIGGSMVRLVERVALGQAAENRAYTVASSWYTYADVNAAKLRITEQMQLMAAWKKLGDAIPADACVYHIKPAPMMLYSDRKSFITPLVRNDRAEFMRRARRCRFYYLGAYTYPPYQMAFYPKDYLGTDVRVVSVDHIGVPEMGLVLGVLVERVANWN